MPLAGIEQTQNEVNNENYSNCIQAFQGLSGYLKDIYINL